MADGAVRQGPQGGSGVPPEAKTKPAVLPDPVYEFSAPRFYDFATNSQDLPSSERADAWFDTAGTECNACLNDFPRPVCSCFMALLRLCVGDAALTGSAAETGPQQSVAAKAAVTEASQAFAMVRQSVAAVQPAANK